MSKRPKIYVSGPYTQGDVVKNTRLAIQYGDQLYNSGFIPYIPHLTHFWHLVFPRKWEDWIDMDKEWVLLCDGVFRIKGPSKGADIECKLAEDNGIPIFYQFGDLLRHFKDEVHAWWKSLHGD